MGVYYETIPKSLVPWIMEQQMFWVGTAPLSPDGHINISPKGGQHFGILDERTFWYMELTGSGVETLAHLYERMNGRMVIMFTAFTGPPRIVRFWGTGRAIENGTPEFSTFVATHNITPIPGTRSIIQLSLTQCGTSCGFSIPFYDFVSHRTTLGDHFAKKAAKFEAGDENESMDRYWAWKSAKSVDGLPGMKRGVVFAEKEGVKPLKKFVGRLGEVAERRGGINAMSMGQDVEVWHLLVVLILGMLIGGAGVLSFVTPEEFERLRGFAAVF